MEGINVERMINKMATALEPPVRHHLKNVYATVAIASICAAAGGYAHLYSSIIGAGFLTGIAAIGTLIAFLATPHNGKNQSTRLAILGVFAFLSGCNMGPLLHMAITINPAIIMQAFLGTSCVFACFSLAAIFAPRGHFLYLGGTLMSLLSTLMWVGLLNLFIGSRLIFQAHLYIGLAVMCGFIAFDTQSIIEKRRLGNDDYVSHGMELFIDFIAVFKRLLIILTDKEANQRRNNKRRD